MFYEAVEMKESKGRDCVSEIPCGLLETGRYTKNEILEKISNEQVRLENLRLILNRHD